MTDQTDPRDVLRRALAAASAIIAGIEPEQYGDPTPCTEFDVTALTNHLTGAVRRTRSIAEGVEISGLLETGDEVPEEGFAAAFDAAADGALAAWEDDALLGKTFTLPWATMPGAGIVQMYAMEAALHSWDLAVATGQEELLDDSVSAELLPLARQFLPAEHRGGDIPFAPVVEVPEDARPADQLAGFTGRSRP